MQYWQIAEPWVKDFSDDIVRDMVMGKRVSNSCRLSLIHNLWFYLDIIEQQREIDYSNGIFTNDYVTLYCINKIKDQLRCSGIDGNTISQLIGVYFNDAGFGYGIGSMIIEGAVNPFHVRGDNGQSTGYTSTTVPSSVINYYTTYIINQNINQCCSIKVLRANISSDSTFLTIIPANYRFVAAVFVNTVNAPAQLSLGTTVGGVEAFGSVGMNPLDLTTSGITTIDVNKVFSLTNPTTLYLNHASMGDQWNGAIFNIEFIFEKL